MSVDTVVYNQSAIQTWEEELSPLLPRISELSNVITEKEKILKPYEQKLNSIDSRILPKEKTLNSIKSRISAEEYNRNTINSRIFTIKHQLAVAPVSVVHHHHHSYCSVDVIALQNEVIALQGSLILSNQTLSVLQSELAENERDLKPLESEREQIKQDMKHHENEHYIATYERNSLLSRKLFLEQKISKGKQFLQTLNNPPQDLVTGLVRDIQEALTEYEQAHLQGVIPQVRVCLIAMRKGLDALIKGGKEDTLELQRTNYLRLCGFIYDMHAHVKGQDPQFETLLAQLIANTHVLQEGDLPDNFETGKNAKAWFNEAKDNNPKYLAIQLSNLNDIEQEMIDEELSEIKKQVHAESHKINHATDAITAEIDKKKKKQEPIDYYFYLQTLRTLNDLAKNPRNMKAAERLEKCAKNASGHPSVGKKVLGSLLVVLGVLLIAASIALFAFTLGAGAAISTLGIASGVTASTLGVGLGAGTTFFGANRIQSGQRQGLSKELMDVKNDIKING